MHFYTKTEGKVQPRHFVPMTKDPSKTRPSRTTDARKALKSGEVWYPSVTGILNVLDKPALVNWKVDKHLEQAFEVYENRDFKDASFGGFDSYKKTIKAITQEAMDAAPKAGTDIHKVLEDHLFLTTPKDAIEAKIVKSCEVLIMGLETADDVSLSKKEQYFIDETLGYAGCADLVVGNWVIDYKSKQEAAKFKPGKMAYPEHHRQLAAYGRALIGENFRAANIFICLETGEIDFHEHDQEKLQHGWGDFKDCLSIYNRNTYKAG